MRFLKIFILLLLACCQSNPKVPLTSISGNEMTIDYTIKIGKLLTDEEVHEIQKIIAVAFQEVNDTHNKWNPNSELSQLNQLPAFEKVPISKELYSLLQLADRLNVLSMGRFDPTIEPLQQLWKGALVKGHPPTEDEIERIKPAIGWANVHFDEHTFWKEHSLTSLDLCGIAKGHLVDIIIERLEMAGYKDVFVEWGGEIRANGKHPSSRPWTIFISQFGDSDPRRAIAIIALTNESIATSGDYAQFWECQTADGIKRYFHVMNPLTLSPLEMDEKNIASASVIAPSCALADGLATSALFFDDEKKANDWLTEIKQEFPNIKYWVKSR